MNETLGRSPLHAWHVAHHGRMVDFAGWAMPLLYTSIRQEHVATRSRAALFDVSHMGRLEFTGDAAQPTLDRLLTRRTDDQQSNQIRYSLVTNEQGGILDDVLVYRMVDPAGQERWQLVVNASNRAKLIQWFTGRLSGSDVVRMSDRTQQTAMFALQGPAAISIAQAVLPSFTADRLNYYRSMFIEHQGVPLLVSRTGYTGEDGIELIVPEQRAMSLWASLYEAGEQYGLVAAGLGARDTLRLEAGMPLYGHELSEEVDPYEADLAFAVDLRGRQFPGSRVLQEKAQTPPARKRVGLLLSPELKRAARQGYAVLDQQKRPIGLVSSGTFSPTLERPIAMAFVTPPWTAVGSRVWVDVRGRPEPADVAPLPFYRRNQRAPSQSE